MINRIAKYMPTTKNSPPKGHIYVIEGEAAKTLLGGAFGLRAFSRKKSRTGSSSARHLATVINDKTVATGQLGKDWQMKELPGQRVVIATHDMGKQLTASLYSQDNKAAPVGGALSILQNDLKHKARGTKTPRELELQKRADHFVTRECIREGLGHTKKPGDRVHFIA